MPRFAPRMPVPLALAMLLSACGSEPSPDDAGPAGATAEETAVEAAAAPPAANATLDLEADGIVIPAQGGAGQAEQMALPFGTMRAAAEMTLQSIVGSPLARGRNEECGAGPIDMTEYDGLTLHFQDDRLVGYYATAPYVPVLTREDMLKDPAVAPVPESTLGAEFTIGNPQVATIGGLFANASDDARIESLWAGTTCTFR